MWKSYARILAAAGLVLLTLALALWTWQGYTSVQAARARLDSPLAIIPVTAATPTRAAKPAPIPQGPFELTWHPDTRTLTGPDGATVFELDALGQWSPYLPHRLKGAVPKGSQVVKQPGGGLALVDPQGKTLYRWDEQRWAWLAEADVPLEFARDPSDPTRFALKSGGLEALRAKSSSALVDSAPVLEGGDYGLEKGALKAVRVLRLGENGHNPLIIYTNDSSQTRLALDAVEGKLYQASQDDYQDPASGFITHILLLSPPVEVKPGEPLRFTRYDFRAGVYSPARALFDYTLALNNFYSNHTGQFNQMTGASTWKNDRVQARLDRMSAAQIEALQKQALKQFQEDIQDLQYGQRITTRMGYGSGSIRFGGQELWLVLRTEAVSIRYNLPNQFDDAFAEGEYAVKAGGQDTVEVQVKAFERDPAVGGWLVETLRELTAGGAVRSFLSPSEAVLQRSTTDRMAAELCGEKTIDSYLAGLTGFVIESGIVPRFDRRTQPPSLCGLEVKQLGK